jgi:hypothetical protein
MQRIHAGDRHEDTKNRVPIKHRHRVQYISPRDVRRAATEQHRRPRHQAPVAVPRVAQLSVSARPAFTNKAGVAVSGYLSGRNRAAIQCEPFSPFSGPQPPCICSAPAINPHTCLISNFPTNLVWCSGPGRQKIGVHGQRSLWSLHSESSIGRCVHHRACNAPMAVSLNPKSYTFTMRRTGPHFSGESDRAAGRRPNLFSPPPFRQSSCIRPRSEAAQTCRSSASTLSVAHSTASLARLPALPRLVDWAPVWPASARPCSHSDYICLPSRGLADGVDWRLPIQPGAVD